MERKSYGPLSGFWMTLFAGPWYQTGGWTPHCGQPQEDRQDASGHLPSKMDQRMAPWRVLCSYYRMISETSRNEHSSAAAPHSSSTDL